MMCGISSTKQTHMLCDQNQGAVKSHDEAWASTNSSNHNLLPIWFWTKLDHGTFRNLSLLPSYSQPSHPVLLPHPYGDPQHERLSFKSPAYFLSHLLQCKRIGRTTLLHCLWGEGDKENRLCMFNTDAKNLEQLQSIVCWICRCETNRHREMTVYVCGYEYGFVHKSWVTLEAGRVGRVP